jgi:gas vesicle protein
MKKFLIGLLAGVSAGILFAPQSGKKLRETLKNSDDAFSEFGKALLDAGKDAGSEVQAVIEGEDMQKILASGKKGVEDFLAVLEEKSHQMSKKAQDELHSLVETAIDAAQEAKKKTTRSIAKKIPAAKNALSNAKSSAKKSVKKTVSGSKKTAKKAAGTAKKAVKKTATKK